MVWLVLGMISFKFSCEPFPRYEFDMSKCAHGTVMWHSWRPLSSELGCFTSPFGWHCVHRGSRSLNGYGTSQAHGSADLCITCIMLCPSHVSPYVMHAMHWLDCGHACASVDAFRETGHYACMSHLWSFLCGGKNVMTLSAFASGIKSVIWSNLWRKAIVHHHWLTLLPLQSQRFWGPEGRK